MNIFHYFIDILDGEDFIFFYHKPLFTLNAYRDSKHVHFPPFDVISLGSHMNRARSVILDCHEHLPRAIRDHAHVSAAGTFALCGRVVDGGVERLADAFVASELVVDDVFNSVGWHCFIRSGQSIQGKGYVWLMFPFL